MEMVRRCICDLMKWESIFLNFIPMCTICVLYLLILYTIIERGISANTVVISTSIIVLTGVLTAIPGVLFQVMRIDMRYEVKNVLLVTVYYVNGIINPLVYFCFNPRVREKIRKTTTRTSRLWRRKVVIRVNDGQTRTHPTNKLETSQL